MGKRKTASTKDGTGKKVSSKKSPAGLRKPARGTSSLAVLIIPEKDLAAHFPAVEAAVREGRLDVGAGLLGDPLKRTTILAHLLLEYCVDRLADYPPAKLFWTRWYWQNRLCRMHEQLEHGGKRCDVEREFCDNLVEQAAGFASDWDATNWETMDRVEAQAVADADTALGPGPFKRPKFACGDIRPLR
ncbi:MAG: hypothetical protein QM703_10685 [Gemmatales bacterium]